LKLGICMSWTGWCTPNSLKDSNVSPSKRQRKKEKSEHTP
jgi:hypothetical protein